MSIADEVFELCIERHRIRSARNQAKKALADWRREYIRKNDSWFDEEHAEDDEIRAHDTLTKAKEETQKKFTAVNSKFNALLNRIVK